MTRLRHLQTSSRALACTALCVWSAGADAMAQQAKAGDWVLRNRCPDTGNEEYLVAADKVAERYTAAGSGQSDGWQAFTPRGKALRFLILSAAEAPFEFMACGQSVVPMHL
jgi:hypothetical protein